ncbi:MAG TPA: hypothetical protein VLT45_01075 [Kofleriaceae bacterium]|nr:hypothetical protein [Kofleriaceae bacterium]
MLRVVLVVVLVGGCSFFTMRSPHGAGPPQCEDGYGYPAIDTVAAIVAPFIIYQILYNSASSSDSADTRQFGAVIGTFVMSIPVVGVEGTAAIYGFIKRDRCERAKRDYVQLVTPPPFLVPAPPPGPGGPAPAP